MTETSCLKRHIIPNSATRSMSSKKEQLAPIDWRHKMLRLQELKDDSILFLPVALAQKPAAINLN